MTDILIRSQKRQKHRRGKGRVMTAAETRVIDVQAKELQRLTAGSEEEAKENSTSIQSQRDHSLTLILDFQSHSWENKFWLFKATHFVVLC